MSQQALFTLQPPVPLHGEIAGNLKLVGCPTGSLGGDGAPSGPRLDPGCEFECVHCPLCLGKGGDEGNFRVDGPASSWRSAIARMQRRPGSASGASACVALGAGDPYQFSSVQSLRTLRTLRELASGRGHSVRLTTRSARVKGDVHLLRAIAAHNDLRISLAVISLDDRIHEGLEGKTSSPEDRLEALRQLVSAGLCAGVRIDPVIPGLTDSLASLERVIRAARESEARFVSFRIFSLRDRPKERFLSYVKENHADLYFRYRRFCGERGEIPESYRRLIATRVRTLKLKYGYGSRRYPAGRESRGREPIQLGFL